MFASLGKSIKGVLFETDPNEAKAVVVVADPQASIGLASTSLPQATGINPEYVAAIRKAALTRQSPLTQLMDQLDKFATIIQDPMVRMKAAHASVPGLTVKQLSDAVDAHLSDVDGEELKFKAMIDSKIAQDVGGVQAEAEGLAKQIAQAQADIQAAQTRIAELGQEIGTLSGQLSQAQNLATTKKIELDQASQQFKVAAQAVRSELTSNKQAILTSLTA